MNPLSRVILHARCIARRPRNARRHLAGIRREAALAVGLFAALVVAPVVLAALYVITH